MFQTQLYASLGVKRLKHVYILKFRRFSRRSLYLSYEEDLHLVDQPNAHESSTQVYLIMYTFSMIVASMHADITN